MAFLNKDGVERLWLHTTSKLNEKVDKIKGKGLSTNDYTNEEKEQLVTLNNLVDNMYGIVRQEGVRASAESLEGLAISAVTNIDTIQSGSGDAAIDNIRTIVGRDAINLYRVGKNFCELGTVSFKQYKEYILNNPIPAGTYTFTATVSSTDTDKSYCVAHFMTGTKATTKLIVARSRQPYAVVFANDINAIRFYASDIYANGAGDTATFADIQIEVNAENVALIDDQINTDVMAAESGTYSNVVATAYEPYNGTFISTELPETVYGGKYDWSNGLLTITHKRTVLTGTEIWAEKNNGTSNHYFYTTIGATGYVIKDTGICSHYPTVVITPSNTDIGVRVANLSDGDAAIVVRPDLTTITSVSDWQAYLAAQYEAGTPVEVVYEITVPIINQLVPQQLISVEGINYVWSDCGNSEVRFNYAPFIEPVNQIINAKNLAPKEEVDNLSEQLELAINGEEVNLGLDYEVYPGYYNSGGSLIGTNGVNSLHTSKIERSKFKQIVIGQIPAGTGYICFFNENEEYLGRENVSSNSVVSELNSRFPQLATSTYVWIQWYNASGASENDFRNFVIFESTVTSGASIKTLTKSAFKTEKNLILRKDFYVMPQWHGMVDWIEDFSENEMTNDFVNNSNFSEWYSRYHALITEFSDTGLEEINMTEDYLLNNPSDTLPSYISDIENGGFYLYHLPPLSSNGNSYTFTGKLPKIFLVSGLHGIEKPAIYYNYKLLCDLCKDEGKYRDITLIRNFCDIYILPLASPYGVQNASRYNGNGINLNRDFAVTNWILRDEEGYPEAPNSQFETRLISYWIKKLSPQIVNDTHTSSGDEESESGKFVNWGGSIVPQINVLLEQHIRDITPYIREHFSPKFSDFKNIIYGHAEPVNTGTRKSGRLPNYASQQGALGISFELVKRLRWNNGTEETPNYVTLFAEGEDQMALCTLNYFTYRHWLVEFITTAVDILNHTDHWDEYVELLRSDENFDAI